MWVCLGCVVVVGLSHSLGTGPESDLIFGMQLFLYMIIADKSCIA